MLTCTCIAHIHVHFTQTCMFSKNIKLGYFIIFDAIKVSSQKTNTINKGK